MSNTPSRFVVAITCACVAIYFGFSPLLWLPFAGQARRGIPLPSFVPKFFAPIRILFDSCPPYNELIYRQAQILGVDDFDYEGRILGTN